MTARAFAHVGAPLWGALLAIPFGCSVEPIDIEGKQCPCAAEYTCDPRTKRCIIGNATGGMGGAASGGAAGAGGGAGGSTSDASAGGSAAGGTSAGGSSAGGTSAGGTSAGGTSAGGTGGTSAGGTSAGGTSAGGTSSGGGGSGGAADAGSDASLTPGSCVGNCSLDNVAVPGSNPKCYCDAACETFNDCCSDKIAVCGKAPPDGGG